MRKDERGQSVSAFVAVVVVALLIVAGLVVDGGAQAAATRRAEVAAAAAARAGTDAGAKARVAGQREDASSLRAATAALASHGVTGAVEVRGDGTVVVRTEARVSTTFLLLIGVGELHASGYAESELQDR